jgi:hypothetical protein
MTSRKWQHLTTSAETFSLIPNLLWTDYAANLLTGTNSRLDTGAVIGEVVLLERYITYQYRFGILAFAACGLWLVLVILCISLTLLPDSRARLTPYNMRLLLNKLSPGRYMALVGDLDGKLLRMSTKDWIRTAGHEPVEISGNGERRHIMSVDEDTSS